MSEVLDKIKSRRSIRKYRSDMIPQDKLEKIIEAGTYAATGMGKQSPIIIAVTNKELRDKLSAMNAKIMGVDKPYNVVIIGFGNIGRAVAKIARALEMNVLVNSRSAKDMPEGCRQVSREELLRESDVVTIHCPLTPDTERMINREALALMKPTAILINTSRGQVIDEQALADALNQDKLYAAALDVLSQEPPKEGNPLLTAKNCVITPHIAWASKDARSRLIRIAADNITAFVNGSVQNNVAK